MPAAASLIDINGPLPSSYSRMSADLIICAYATVVHIYLKPFMGSDVLVRLVGIHRRIRQYHCAVDDGVYIFKSVCRGTRRFVFLQFL